MTNVNTSLGWTAGLLVARADGEAGAGELDLAVGGGVELEQAEVRVLAGGEDDITGVSSLQVVAFIKPSLAAQ